MINDFRIAIGTMGQVREEMRQVDVDHVWTYSLPNTAATESDLLYVEENLGYSLDERYCQFLLRANGWRNFYHTVDLFGTNDLLNGNQFETGQMVFSYLEETVLSASRLARVDLYPVAATKFDRDIFLLGKPGTSISGNVFWFAGEEIDRWANFDDFFLSMIEYSRESLVWLRARKSKK